MSVVIQHPKAWHDWTSLSLILRQGTHSASYRTRAVRTRGPLHEQSLARPSAPRPRPHQHVVVHGTAPLTMLEFMRCITHLHSGRVLPAGRSVQRPCQFVSAHSLSSCTTQTHRLIMGALGLLETHASARTSVGMLAVHPEDSRGCMLARGVETPAPQRSQSRMPSNL